MNMTLRESIKGNEKKFVNAVNQIPYGEYNLDIEDLDEFCQDYDMGGSGSYIRWEKKGDRFMITKGSKMGALAGGSEEIIFEFDGDKVVSRRYGAMCRS